jgi:hypothetical protein
MGQNGLKMGRFHLLELPKLFRISGRRRFSFGPQATTSEFCLKLWIWEGHVSMQKLARVEKSQKHWDRVIGKRAWLWLAPDLRGEGCSNTR